MIDTILFDLDGTLLPISMDEFINLYFSGLAHHFKDMVEPQQLISMIGAAFDVMVNDTQPITNEVVFMDAFEKYLEDGELELYQARFMDYYQHHFDDIKAIVKPNQQIQAAVELLKAKGYQMIVATNPLFPEIAILKRIAWAGFDAEDFIHVTTYEKSHYAKPYVQYYEAILKDNDLVADQCLMVGNDPLEDMVASRLGLKTYLIEDHIVERDEHEHADYKGSYDDFYEFVKGLPNLKKEKRTWNGV